MKCMESNPSVPMLFPIEPAEFWAQIRQIVHEEFNKTQRNPLLWKMKSHFCSERKLLR
jgi:hypothetical protein